MAAYNFTGLNAFTDVKGELYGAILKGMQSADIWTAYPDTITTTVIPVVSDTLGLIESGSLPLSSDSGATNFSAMTLSPIDVGAVRGYTAADFTQYYGKYQNSVQLEQQIPFEQFLYEYILTKFMEGYEDKMWNHGSAGIAAKLYSVSGRCTNVTYTAMTASNAEVVMQSYFSRKPSILAMETNEVYISATDFENYVLALQVANKFDPASFASNVKGNSYTVPGTAGNLTVFGFHALNSKSLAFLTNKGNFGWGYGSEQDFTNTHQFAYDLNSDKRIFRMHTKLSVGCHIPEQVLRAS